MPCIFCCTAFQGLYTCPPQCDMPRIFCQLHLASASVALTTGTQLCGCLAQCSWLMTRCARLANGRPPCQQTLMVLLRWNKRFRAHNCCGAKGQPFAPLNRSYLNRHTATTVPLTLHLTSSATREPACALNIALEIAINALVLFGIHAHISRLAI
jgi:hypothetical protein